MFKEYKDKKKGDLGKDRKSYETRENVNFEEQKPILLDDFTKEEEELAQKAEARKRKRRAVAEKIKNLNGKKSRLKMKKKRRNFGSDCVF